MADANPATAPASGPAASGSNNASSSEPPAAPVITGDPRKDAALVAYKKSLKSHEDLSDGLKKSELRPDRSLWQ